MQRRDPDPATTPFPTLKGGIRRAPLREQIARRLSDLVASGLLREGDELPGERELAATLEVSRESLRGALQLLADRGVLEIGHGTRTRVRAVAEHDGGDLLSGVEGMTDALVIEARRALEPAMAELAAARVTDEALARLERMLATQRGIGEDAVRFQIADREFHCTVFAAAASPVLEGFAVKAYDYAYRYRRELMTRHGSIPLVIEDHARVLTALRRRDPAAAGDAMRGHIDTIATLLAGVPGGSSP